MRQAAPDPVNIKYSLICYNWFPYKYFDLPLLKSSFFLGYLTSSLPHCPFQFFLSSSSSRPLSPLYLHRHSTCVPSFRVYSTTTQPSKQMNRLQHRSVSDYDYILHLSEHKLTRYQYQRTEIALRKHVLIRNLLIKAHTISSDTDDEEEEEEEDDEADQPLMFGRQSRAIEPVTVDTDKSKEENWFETCFDQLDQDNVDSVIIDYSSSDEDDEDMEDGTVPRWVQDVRERYSLSSSSRDVEEDEEDDTDDLLKLASLESSCDYFLRTDKDCSMGSFDPFGGDDVVQDSNFVNKYSWIEWRHDPITL